MTLDLSRTNARKKTFWTLLTELALIWWLDFCNTSTLLIFSQQVTLSFALIEMTKIDKKKLCTALNLFKTILTFSSR